MAERLGLVRGFMASGGSDTPAADDDFWYGIPGTTSNAGERVSTDSAMTIPAVYGCDRVLCDTIGSLPLPVYRRLPNGKGKERATEHPMYARLHDGISMFETSMDWRSLLQNALNFRGNSYTECTDWKSDGTPGRMRTLRADRVEVDVLKDNRGVRYRYTEDDGYQHEIPPENMLHLKGQPKNMYLGMSPIEVQRELFGRAQAIDRASSALYKNGVRPSLALKRPKDAPKLTEAAAMRLKVDFSNKHAGAGNFGSVPLLEEGMELQTYSLAPKDAQWLETMGFTLERVCGIFGVPPHMIAHLLRATFSNIEHQGIDFAMHAIRPRLVRLEQRLNQFFFGDDPEYFCEFMLDALLRGDSAARSAYYNTMVMAGIMTRNEARALENLNWLPGLDEPMTQMNMQGASAPRPATGGAPAPQRAMAVVAKVAEREHHREVEALRRVAKRHASGGDIAGWAAAVKEFYGEQFGRLQDALAMDEDVARNYCALHERDLLANGVAVLESWTSQELATMATAA